MRTTPRSATVRGLRLDEHGRIHADVTLRGRIGVPVGEPVSGEYPAHAAPCGDNGWPSNRPFSGTFVVWRPQLRRIEVVEGTTCRCTPLRYQTVGNAAWRRVIAAIDDVSPADVSAPR